MNSMEFNKIAAGVIGALLAFLLLGFFSGMIYGTRGGAEHAEGDEHGPVLAYAVPVEAEAGAGGEEAEQVDLFALFQEADAAAGEGAFRACGACHAVEDGVNKVGPHLYDVVGRQVASVAGFAYSDAMAAHGGSWTPAELSAFLENPKAHIPGTKMSFAGVKDHQARANLIAYLNEIGGSPVDLTEGLSPLAPGEGSAEGSGEAAPDAEAAAAPAEGGSIATDAGSEGQGQGAVSGEAAPGATTESMTESTASSMPQAQPDVTVTDVQTVDTSKEGVEVEHTPVEVTGTAPAEAPAGQATGAVEPAPAEPATEAAPAAQEQGAAAPAEGTAAGQQVAAATPAPAEGGALAGDAAAGEKLFRRCAACHKLEEGAKAVGPHLAGIVGRDVASVEGFAYSDAMAAHEGTWTPEELSAFIADPKGYVPGTKMAFAGLKDEKDRIDLITYLQQAAQ